MNDLSNGTPHYPQGPAPQYPQYPPVPPAKKKKVWPWVLLGGCGCLALVAAIIVVTTVWFINQPDPNDTTSIINEMGLKDKTPIVRASANDITKHLHINMPKDSVLMALGMPSEYQYAKWADQLLYEYHYNDSTTNYVIIYFNNNVVSDFFVDSLPE